MTERITEVLSDDVSIPESGFIVVKYEVKTGVAVVMQENDEGGSGNPFP